ncbi:hypothetical protein RZS08_35470, partial [Arthrospira platensis SPKY1]|nr:hypothetical protein [Arthrospira platensis SPKY1]
MQPASLSRLPVTLRFAEGNGQNSQLMFVGRVASVDYNPATRVARLTCSDGLQQVVARTPKADLDALIGGTYSPAVSGNLEGYPYALARLASTPQSIALEVTGNLRVLPWRNLPQSLSLGKSDILDRSVSLQLPRAE